MFEIGKQYKNGNKTAKCVFAGNSCAVLRHDNDPKAEFTISVNTDDWWTLYTPPKVEKIVRGVEECSYTEDGIRTFVKTPHKGNKQLGSFELTITDGVLTDARVLT